MGADFRQLCLAISGVKPGDFERWLFRRCLFRHALPFAGLLRRWKPNFFREDLDFVREAGSCHNTRELISELNRFYGRNARDGSFLRTRLLFRVSGKQVLRIYRDLLAQSEAAGAGDSAAGLDGPELPGAERGHAPAA